MTFTFVGKIPKMRPESFTNQYGLIVDYLAEWMREIWMSRWAKQKW